jgi:hypothetical protein
MSDEIAPKEAHVAGVSDGARGFWTKAGEFFTEVANLFTPRYVCALEFTLFAVRIALLYVGHTTFLRGDDASICDRDGSQILHKGIRQPGLLGRG